MYKKIKFGIRHYRSEGFMKWFREKYPGMDPHHIFGSIGAMKVNDLFCAAVRRNIHDKLQADLEGTFEDVFVMALNILVDYVEYLEKKLLNYQKGTK